ncbi:MAG: 30S ribosome-binding factor RbfA [Clostridiales bacterium]|nr:30S ribosome-binding factor RbfA [Clostridiales bacterium]
MKKNGTKNLRINEEVGRELSRIIRELKDPRISMMTSVMDAYVATDLKTCKVYVSVLGDETRRSETMRGLESAKGFIRRELAHSLNMRNTPELTFVMDRSIERGAEMSRRIDEVIRHDEEVERQRDGHEDGGKEPADEQHI